MPAREERVGHLTGRRAGRGALAASVSLLPVRDRGKRVTRRRSRQRTDHRGADLAFHLPPRVVVTGHNAHERAATCVEPWIGAEHLLCRVDHRVEVRADRQDRPRVLVRWRRRSAIVRLRVAARTGRRWPAPRGATGRLVVPLLLQERSPRHRPLLPRLVYLAAQFALAPGRRARRIPLVGEHAVSSSLRRDRSRGGPSARPRRPSCARPARSPPDRCVERTVAPASRGR